MEKGYWVVRAHVDNLEEYSKYIDIATSIIKNHNGKFLIRGGKQTEFEKKGFERTVVVEFNSYKDAVECYKSSEYQSALKYVENSSLRLVSVVEGI
ncbi:MAG: hypothetical protein CMD46_03605 [Gammaproteobacteria bacterium]|nr:hypothetical protein [Gammaproteobacteria bacterium]|tara:strand:+ start:3450 stop:3737 length:288 start_codon:yes stop_codon:yes gene_type:complete